MSRFIVTPEGIVIEIVDINAVRTALAKFIFDQLKASIAAEDILNLLPFRSAIVFGEHHTHIQNDSAYPVYTKYHVIGRGDTLCAKVGQTYFPTRVTPSCPGCIAKARGVIVNNLMKGFEGDAFAVADALKQVEQFGFFRR